MGCSSIVWLLLVNAARRDCSSPRRGRDRKRSDWPGGAVGPSDFPYYKKCRKWPGAHSARRPIPSKYCYTNTKVTYQCLVDHVPMRALSTVIHVCMRVFPAARGYGAGGRFRGLIPRPADPRSPPPGKQHGSRTCGM